MSFWRAGVPAGRAWIRVDLHAQVMSVFRSGHEIGTAVILFVLDWRLALATLGVTPLMAGATAVFRTRSARAYRKVRETLGLVTATLAEDIAGMRIVQAFTREDANTRNFKEVSERYRDSNMETVVLNALYFPFVDLLSSIALAVVLGYGGHLYFGGQVVSVTGTWMQNIAMAWLILELTHDPLLLGAVGQLQLDVVAHRLEGEYQARARMTPSNYKLARWVSAADPAELARFIEANAYRVAYDVVDAPAVLYGHQLELKAAREIWPNIQFHAMREHGGMVVHTGLLAA